MTFAEKRRIKVTAAGAPLRELNELEVVKGEIFANVWQTDYVARIAPDTGKVVGYIDLRGLLSPSERATAESQGGVLNGIAYDAGARSAVRHRQAVAEAVRDQASDSPRNGVGQVDRVSTMCSKITPSSGPVPRLRTTSRPCSGLP